MPGLPTRPCIYDIDLNLETGDVEGLFWKSLPFDARRISSDLDFNTCYTEEKTNK